MNLPAAGGRPFVLGLGGTGRPGSATERALRLSLAAAEAMGGQTALVAGVDLILPHYTPEAAANDERAQRLIALLRRCHGIIVASPSYHGSVSGTIKNALDYVEELRGDDRVYFDGCAFGCIVCCGGEQAGGQTLAAMRAIAHALRAWPSPLGAVVNTSREKMFGPGGEIASPEARAQLEIVGRQVTEFARMSHSFQRLRMLSLEVDEMMHL